MKLINLQLTKSNYFCYQYFAYNSCHKYPLKYQSKFLAHFTIFTEYCYKTTSKGALLRKVPLQITDEKNNGCSYTKVQGSWTHRYLHKGRLTSKVAPSSMFAIIW